MTPSARRRQERRDAVARMARDGRSRSEIAAALGVCVETVAADCLVMGVSTARRSPTARYRLALERIAEGVIDSAQIAREALKE